MKLKFNLTIVTVTLVVCVAVLAVLGTVTGTLALTGLSDTSHRALRAAHQAQGAAAEAQTAASEAQAATSTLAINRRATILEGCQDQNRRNKRTIHTLDTRLAKAAKTLPPSQRAQLKTSRTFTVALINALAPNRNCAIVLRKAGF